jgi:hypothetical protein
MKEEDGTQRAEDRGRRGFKKLISCRNAAGGEAGLSNADKPGGGSGDVTEGKRSGKIMFNLQLNGGCASLEECYVPSPNQGGRPFSKSPLKSTETFP